MSGSCFLTLDPAPLQSASLDWTPEGAPRSQRFGDIYFSRDGGLDESRAVFLQGCGLPGAWAGRSHFTVAELGFGTGLNILALLQLWRRTRAPGQRLSIFSVEGYPLSRDEAARALAAWPELDDLTQTLLDAWPRLAPGFHRLEWPHLGATLDIAIGEVDWALAQWSGAADAWFLDGFSPALNPGMWSDAVLGAVADHCAPGARLATFTVAGAVRRGLQAGGFTVDKRPGHGTKRERLEAVFLGEPRFNPLPSVAVIGAGIAGAAVARALQAAGIEPAVIEAEESGAGASGNPAALVTPALDAGGGPRASFYAQAFARAVDLYRAVPGAVIGQGVQQLEAAPRDAARFDTVQASGLFAPGALTRTPGGLRFEEGLWIRPTAVLDAWLPATLRGRAAKLERREGRWAVLNAAGSVIVDADAIVLAAGAASALLADLPLSPVRGQVSWTKGLHVERAAAWGGYAIPTDDGVLFGATHDRGRIDTEVLAEDHARNLQTLAQAFTDLAAAASTLPLEGRAALRAATRDRMPIAGEVIPGVYVLSGLGSRGFTTAPILAEYIASLLTMPPSPLPYANQAIVDTSRLRKI